ncbi:MAG: hypothetical protein NVSMB51_08960 [Solirubrobacteraceae bacterium]
MPLRKLITLLCCAGALASTAALDAAAALAASDQTALFEAPPDLLNAQRRPGALTQMDALGVHAIRLVLLWRDVAPAPKSAARPNFDATDPRAYSWGEYDAAVQAAEQRGWNILLTVSGPVPRWATPGGVDNTTRPDVQEFGRFMTAIGRHYGSTVKLISIWNEPNHPEFLNPQYVEGRPASPRIYRGLYQAGVAGLQASGNFDGMKVLIGETAPRGTGHDVAPLTFLRGALCLDNRYRRAASCSPLQTDGWAHHAYTTLAGPFFKPREPNDVTIGVLPRLTRALDRAGRTGAIPRNLPIYLTEFGIQSYPDPFNGVSLTQQPEYMAIGEHIGWANPRVKMFSQYLLRDEIVGKSKNKLKKFGGFDTGLEFYSGKPKPSYSAWPVPLVVSRRGGRVALWGLARPTRGPTTVNVQVASGRRGFKTLLAPQTDALGYWRGAAAYRAGLRWRLSWTAPGGRTYVGPPIRAYDRAGRLQR